MTGRRPWWATPHLWRRMKGVEHVMLLGVQYDIPVTEDSEPFAKLLRGERDVWPKGVRWREWRRQQHAANGMRDIIAALLVQVRDTVGHDVTTSLMQEIGDAMRPFVGGRVERAMKDADPQCIEHGRRDGRR